MSLVIALLVLLVAMQATGVFQVPRP
jgi:hypothetical protein